MKLKAAIRKHTNISHLCSLVVLLILMEMGMAVYVHDTMYACEEKAGSSVEVSTFVKERSVMDHQIPMVVFDAGQSCYDEDSTGVALVEKDRTLSIIIAIEEQLKTQGMVDHQYQRTLFPFI